MDKKSAEKEYYDRKDSWNLVNFDKTHFERVKKVLELIPQDSTSLLDVGCGNGILCNQAQIQIRTLKRIVGFDQSLEALKQVKTEKKVGDMTNLPLNDKEFDTVCCLEVLEHMPSNIFFKILQELTRVAKHHIIITVPYKENLSENTLECPNCKELFHRYLHVQSFNSDRLKNLLEKFGFMCTDVKPIIKYEKKIGQLKFLKMIGRNPQHYFGNAICPYCGYYEKKSLKKSNKKDQELKQSVNRLWPTKKEFKWFLGIYKIKST